MESDHSDQSNNEPNAKRCKIETVASTSSKLEVNDDCPILILPEDILAKVLAFIPIAQWPALELLYDFRPATLIAWRELRNINVDRDFLIKPGNRASWSASVLSILQTVIQRSPFLTSISGINIQSISANFILDIIRSLAQFEHLQSITFGDKGAIRLADLVDFLESTRSRASLKQLRFSRVILRQNELLNTILDQFASSFVAGREIQSPLLLEKFSYASVDRSIFIRLDTMDTTRLIELRGGKASIEPQQLTNLIGRASKLRRIEFTFLHCRTTCNGPRLQANKQLLIALASHECLTAIEFDSMACKRDCRCMHFGVELIQMLETIGGRGQLKKLAIGNFFVLSSTIDLHAVFAMVCKRIPYLQSINFYLRDYFDGDAFDICSLTELEEIDFRTTFVRANVMGKIVQLPRLKRLAFGRFLDSDLFNCLAKATTLTDLRMEDVYYVSAADYVKWSEGFAANLEILMLDRIAFCNEFDEIGFVQLLKMAVRLRVLIIYGHITDQSLKVIAKSCPDLETFGVQSNSSGMTVFALQEIVDRCPKLKRLGGIGSTMRSQLRFPKYRKISDVDINFSWYGFDDNEYF